jgi:large subunit ribosomal protein L10
MKIIISRVYAPYGQNQRGYLYLGSEPNADACVRIWRLPDISLRSIHKERRNIMPNLEKKQAVVNEIKDKLNRTKSVVLVDARGLTVLQDTNLRKTLREAGVDYKVYKNTLVELAVAGTDYEPLKQFLAGPTAAAFSYEDATTAASLISKQLTGMPKLEFKAGFIEGTLYDAEGMKAVAEIPPREVLLSRLLGSFKSPMGSFARVIDQIAKKQGGGDTAEASA